MSEKVERNEWENRSLNFCKKYISKPLAEIFDSEDTSSPVPTRSLAEFIYWLLQFGLQKNMFGKNQNLFVVFSNFPATRILNLVYLKADENSYCEYLDFSSEVEQAWVKELAKFIKAGQMDSAYRLLQNWGYEQSEFDLNPGVLINIKLNAVNKIYQAYSKSQEGGQLSLSAWVLDALWQIEKNSDLQFYPAKKLSAYCRMLGTSLKMARVPLRLTGTLARYLKL